MKNIKYVVWTLIVGWIFGSLFFGGKISNWSNERRNKKIAEDELERLVNDYGLKIQNPVEDRNQCSYWYAMYEILVEKNYYEMGNKKLKDRDIFMVKCIPAIQEISEKCEAERNAIDEKYPYEIRAESLGDKCERDLLNSLVISK